jgi:hypothetical protein
MQNLSKEQRSIWVCYPQGIIRRAMGEPEINEAAIADCNPFPDYQTPKARPADLIRVKPHHPSHALFQ